MSSREAFERWAKKEGYRVFSDARGSYDMPSTNCAWEVWQAATERAAEIAYDHLDDTFLSGHGYATGVSEAIREGNN